MSGICDKCRREPCRMRMDGLKICDLYEGGETNWDLLFGTPERAARTLLDACDNCNQNDCNGCQVYELTSGGDLDYDALLEWLRGDAE